MCTEGRNAVEAYAEAVRRIEEETREKTGQLRLSGLGNLEELPAGISELTWLTKLNCSGTRVSDLNPLVGLTQLQTIYCRSTPVSDLSPLAGLTQLQEIDCRKTQVSDLSPLTGLTQLQKIECSETQVSDLSPLVNLVQLRYLYCDPQACTGIPFEVFNPEQDYSSVSRLLAYLRDCQTSQATAFHDVKLFFLGNGRVGKTQLARALQELPFEENADSTHGIVVSSTTLTQQGETLPLKLWDFGGQDLYHGTHAWFMKSRALALLAWCPDSENSRTHEHNGMVFRNEPLAYWLAFLAAQNDSQTPVIVTQTRCDQACQEQVTLPLDVRVFEQFPFHTHRHTSTKKPRGLVGLKESLFEAAKWLKEQEGDFEIPCSWSAVKQRIEVLQTADAYRSNTEKQHRTLSQAAFAEICTEVGNISSPLAVLQFLHNCGTLFYQENLFANQIILDQGWALDSVYSIFHRAHAVHRLKANRGRFTLIDLQETVLRDKPDAECKLLLSMMQSCRICFVYRENWEDGHEYLAPDLLPPYADLAAEIEEEKAKIPNTTAAPELRYAIDFFHSGQVRDVLSTLGKFGGNKPLYWQEGFLGYEKNYKAWLEFSVTRQPKRGNWAADLVFTAYGQEPLALLEQLELGLRNFFTNPQYKNIEQFKEKTMPDNPKALEFTTPPSTGIPRYAVSYAWGDNTPAGRSRTKIVNELCEKAKNEYGVTITRDKDNVNFGESLSRFMDSLAAHDRIFIILSDKYLKSPNCMNELSKIWQYSKCKEDLFRQTVRVFCLKDAKIFSFDEQIQRATYWAEKADELEQKIQANMQFSTPKRLEELRKMRTFANEMPLYLELFADMLLPRTMPELQKLLEQEFKPKSAG